MNWLRARIRVLKRLLRRESAEHYLFLTLLSFAVSVSVTRLFLTIANYPQVGGGELHIAHVLWGGLLLYIAAILPLLFANRGVYTAGALLAGAGVGLFIDEVGKFITKQNDYFFPIAASLIYVLFLLTLVAFLQIRRAARAQTRDELTRVFEDIWEALHHPLAPGQHTRLKERLEHAVRAAPSERHANLAQALLTFLDADGAPTPAAAAQDKARRSGRAGRRIVGRVFSENSLRVILIIGLLGIGLLMLKNPVTVLLGTQLPPGVTSFLTNLRMGRHIEASTTPIWSSVRLGLEILVGFLLLTSAGLLTIPVPRGAGTSDADLRSARVARRLGTTVGYVGLLLSLTTLDILLFYFEQFSTIITTTIQFALWIGIIVYRRHKR
jgi:hypothetical protein